MTSILDVETYDSVLQQIVKDYSGYIIHHNDKSKYGSMLKFYTSKMDTIYNIFNQMHNYDLIDSDTFVECTKMFIEYNDDLVSVYFDAIKG